MSESWDVVRKNLADALVTNRLAQNVGQAEKAIDAAMNTYAWWDDEFMDTMDHDPIYTIPRITYRIAESLLGLKPEFSPTVAPLVKKTIIDKIRETLANWGLAQPPDLYAKIDTSIPFNPCTTRADISDLHLSSAKQKRFQQVREVTYKVLVRHQGTDQMKRTIGLIS